MADVGIKIKATDEASGVFGKVAAEAGKLQSAVSATGSSFAALAGGFAASVGALSFASKIKEQIDLADSFNKLSQKTGIVVEELSKLNYAAGLADLSTESFAKGIRKLNENISAAAAGGKEQTAFFKALGVSVKDAAGNAKSADLVLSDLAETFSKSADGADKMAVAAKAFGDKVGAEFIPLLNAGKGGIKSMGDEAQKLGIVLGTEFAKNAEEFNDNLKKLQLSGQGLFVTLGGDLVKGLGDAAKEMANAAIEGGKLAGVIAGIQTLLTGTDQYKNDKALVEQTEILFNLENARLQQLAQGYGPDSRVVQNTDAQIKGIKEQLDLTQKYRKVLQGFKDENKDPPKPSTVSPPIKAAAGVIGAGTGTKGPNDYQRITDELDKQLDLANAELEVNRKLTESEKYRVESIDKITDAYVNGEISAEQWADASATALMVADFKQLFEDTQRQIKADLDAAEAHNKYIRSLYEGFDKLQEDTAAMEDHIAKLGLSKTAVADLDAAKLESAATIQDLIVLKKIEQGVDQEQYDIYVKTAAELRKQAALRRTGAAREQQIEDAQEVAKAAAEEWKRGWEATDQLAREAFTSWAEDGASAAKKIGDSLKKALLSAIYEATIKPIALNIYSSIAGGPPAGSNGINGLASGANAASGLNTLWGAGSQFLSGATAGSSALAMTGANAVGAVGGDALGALIAGNGGWAGVSTAATATASTAGATAGAAASSTFMTTLATAAPYLLAAVALAALFKKGEYVQSTGSSVMAFDSTGATTNKSTLANNFSTAQADAYVQGIKDSYTSLTKSLGATNPGGSFAFAANNSDGGKFGVQVGVGSAAYSTGELKATPEAIALEASRAVFAALQGSQLPQYLAGVFDGITATTATQDQINSALAYAKSIKTLHDQFDQLPFENLKNLSLEATKGLLDFAGGLDALGTNLAGYYQNYYSAEEQRAQTIKNITATLNAAGASLTADDVAGATKETFRALVEGQDLATESGRKNYAALLSVQGAFAGLTTEAKAAATATNDASAALAAATAANGYLNGDEGRRIDAAQAVVDGLRSEATQQYIDAQMAVVEAQKNLATVLHTTIKGFEDFLGTLDGAQAPTVRLAGARQNFDDVTARARSGDTAAIGQLTTSAKTFLDLSKGYSASIVDYRRDEAKVRIVLQEGIAAGQKQLLALPKEMQAATDPLKDAYDQLTKASQAEFDARTLAIAMQAKLSTAETSLKDKYLEAVSALPNGKYLSDFFKLTMQTVQDAAKISSAAALAAQKLLAGMYTSAWIDPATTATPAPTPTPGPVVAPGPMVDKTLHGVGGIAMFDNGDFANGPYATDAIKAATEYAAAWGKDALLARVVELGGTSEMLDRLRQIAGPTASFAVGTNFVPQDMIAQIHQGEAIIPAAFNPERYGRASGNDALVAEIQALRAESAKQQETIEALLDTIATQSSSSAHTLRKLDDIGVKTRT